MAKSLSAASKFLIEALRPSRLTTIVDVGANPINEVPYSSLLAENYCKVVGFEPQEAAFKALDKRQSEFEQYFPHAVGDGKSATLRLYKSQGLTSIFEPDLKSIGLLGKSYWTQVEKEVSLKTKALDDIEDLPVFDALKIDIQGGEERVFNGAKRVLGAAVVVIVELRYLRLYMNEPMMTGVDLALRQHGFHLHRFMFNKSMPLANSQSSRLARRKTRDQLIDGDAVYVRDLTTLPEFSIDQLIHLAILASSIFGSHSLVLMVLDELVRREAIAADLPARYADALPPEYLKPADAAAEAEED